MSGFAAAIVESWMVMDIPGLCHLIAQTYSKVTKVFLFTSRVHVILEVAAKTSAGRGIIFPSPGLVARVKKYSSRFYKLAFHAKLFMDYRAIKHLYDLHRGRNINDQRVQQLTDNFTTQKYNGGIVLWRNLAITVVMSNKLYDRVHR